MRSGLNMRSGWDIRSGLWLLVLCWVVCLVGLVVFVSSAFGDGSSLGGVGGSVLESPLVAPGVQVLVGGQGLQEALEVRRASPEAVLAREVSETEYEGLGSGEAALLAEELFAGVVVRPGGGLAQLPEGVSVAGYPTVDAAQVVFPGGGRGVVESSAPVAVEVAGGRRVPLDLGLVEAGGGFEPRVGAVGVRIAKQVQGGVSLAGSGVSLTAVDGSGAALGGSEGVVDGASVFYGNVLADTDMVVKPVALGFQEDALLRSVDSPRQLFFRVGLPAGGSLVQESGGGVAVVLEGAVLAVIPMPVAWDAAGTPVAVSMGVSGDMLALTVDAAPGEFEYPIVVDPTVVDKHVDGNWRFASSGSEFSASEGGESEGWREDISWEHVKNEWGAFMYPTQGESRIYEFTSETSAEDSGTSIENLLGIIGSSGKWEPAAEAMPQSYAKTTKTVCAEAGCSAGAGSRENVAVYWQTATNVDSEPYRLGVNHLFGASVYIAQNNGPSASFDTSEPMVYGKANVLDGGGWLSPSSGAFEPRATDPGIGVDEWSYSSPNSSEWKGSSFPFCSGVQCAASSSVDFEYNKVAGSSIAHPLPDGEDTVEVKAADAMGLSGTATAKVKVDSTPPYALTLAGLPASKEVADKQYSLVAEATDGSGSTPSSGVASIALAVDGQPVGTASGSCSPGKCTAKRAWTLSGESYGPGRHVITITATDYAGNVAREEIPITVLHDAPLPVGPGSVNPVSGEFDLSATDVSVAAPGSSLSISRTFGSGRLSAGVEGPLGPQWALNINGQESISRLADGSVVLTAADGRKTTFTSSEKGGFTLPAGEANLALSEVKNEKGELQEYVLKDTTGGAITRFTSLTGPTGTLWKATKQEGPLSGQAVRYTFQDVEGVTRPTQALAPEPAGVSCSSTLKAGCRALEFVYAKETTAKGEAPSEWGEYKGRLVKISLTAYNPVSRAMASSAVAQYAYDKQGRLRAEWNPSITPVLKSTYAYNAAGQLTAVSAPGQQPWLLSYGSVLNATGASQLLAATRPAASTGLGAGEAPKNTVLPALSSSKPVVGSKLSVSSNGTWSNSPLVYSYQWEDCNASGEACAPIVGAVNQSYYPAVSDEGHTLVAQVSAENADGAVAAASAATSVVATGTPYSPLPSAPSVGSNAVWTVDYQVPVSGSGAPYAMGAKEVEGWAQKDDPVEATAVFPPDEPMGWPAAEYKRASIYYRDSQERTVNVAQPGGAISTSEYNTTNNTIRTLSADNRAAALKEGSKSSEVSKDLDSESTYNAEGTELLETLGPEHEVKLSSGSEVKAREHAKYFYDEGAPAEGGPYELVTKSTDGALIAGKEEADIRTTTTSYSGQENLGWKLGKPTSVTTDPGGLKLTHTTVYEPATGNVAEVTQPADHVEYHPGEASYLSQLGTKGSEPGKLSEPEDAAVDSKGDVWVADSDNNRIEEYSATGEYLKTVGSVGSEPGKLKDPEGLAIDSKGDVWVADTSNSRLEEFSATGEYLKTVGSVGSEPGKLKYPEGLAIDSKGDVWVADTENSRLEEFSATGEYLKTVGSAGSEPGKLKYPKSVAIDSKGDVWVADTYNNRVEEFSATGEYMKTVGSRGEGGGQFVHPHGIAIDARGDVWVSDGGQSERVEEFSASGVYIGSFGSEGSGDAQFLEPAGIGISSTGNMWVADSGHSRVQEFALPGSPHATQTIYYSAESNLLVPGCGEHPEWAGLPCQTQPARQPEGSTLPALPVTTITYNMWDEPETTTETAGSSTRTKTDSYDAAGRLTATATSSTVGATLPTVSYEYNAETGALATQSTTSEGKTRKLTSVYNTLGQLVSYTDADENTSTYTYDIDGRIEKTSDGKGTQTYTYDSTTGDLTKLVDSAAGTFTASYDTEGNLLSEGYPNGMNADYTYNQVGKATGLEYIKTTHCTSGCTWFSDKVLPSIHGQWLSQASSLSTQAYTYDQAGRLTQVQNTPAGKGCTTRIYAYDEDTNRTSLTTRAPGSKGECASEGGSIEKHAYDEADRLTDPSIAYNAFGDITSLPAADAEGSELTSTYYADNQAQTQTQNGQTIGYNLDPAGRTRETVMTGKTNTDIVSHYTGPSDQPAWSTNTAGEWRRDIPGINGQLAAIQNNGETPVLQLANLHGDIIATAYLSETATGLASTADTSEFGVPTVSAPPKYSWLGAIELPTELPSGIINMGARSYIPQLGRFLQPDPRPGGSANAYAYTFGDPVNSTDPTGESVATPAWAIAFLDQQAPAVTEAAVRRAEEEARRAAEQAAAKRQAEQAAAEANWAIERAGPQPEYEEGPEEYEEYEEEEGEYEEAAYHPGARGQEEAHSESGVLVQPLSGEEDDGSWRAITEGSTVPLCKAGVDGPCAEDARLNIRGSLCAGLAIAVAACGHPDEGPPTEHYREAPIERGVGRDAERAEEDGGGAEDGEETVEILCAIFCP
jgi:RHS repeat-associated protein